MSKLLVLLVAIATLFSSCELMKKELKKANTIRKSAQKVCDCSFVSVSTNNNNGVKTVGLKINNSSASDYRENANAIMSQLSEDYPAICRYSSVTIDYGSEAYTFNGCSIDEEEESTDSLEVVTQL